TILRPTEHVTNGSDILKIKAGLYVWSVYCNDTLGNSNTSVANFTLTVSDPVVIIPTGGNTGTSSSSPYFNTVGLPAAVIAAITDKADGLGDVQRGKSQVLGSGDGAVFTGVDGKDHVVVVSGVSWDKVMLTVYSDPVKVILKEGETQMFDLNDNGVDDFEITVKSIDASDSTAEIYFKTLMYEAIPTAGAVVDKEEPVVEEEPKIPTGAAPGVPEEETSNAWIWMLIIVVILGIVFFYFKYKSKPLEIPSGQKGITNKNKAIKS
ncbi:MAG: hypothetical protein L6408_09605, partial [Nanoarchaeota archaeon]|nr:hypothetical protein [Nanoarchaeota archaeon]